MTRELLQTGWGVAVILRTPVNGLACYVGEVQAVDAWGLRITAMDWLTGCATGMDWAFPWDGIAALEVCTDQHKGWDPGITQERAMLHAGLRTQDDYDTYVRERREP